MRCSACEGRYIGSLGRFTRMSQKTLQRVCITIFFLGLGNFAAYWIAGVSLGGNAVSGKAENGRYFLSNHGRLTEVSRGTYFYSRAHTYSVWVTHPVAILAAIAASRMNKREKRPRRLTNKGWN